MSARGKAAVSLSGASMSKYDVEVEARLKALESKAHVPCGEGKGVSEDRLKALEAKVDILIDFLNDNPAITERCPKNENGERKLPL